MWRMTSPWCIQYHDATAHYLARDLLKDLSLYTSKSSKRTIKTKIFPILSQIHTLIEMNMSDLTDIAYQAQRDLNSHQAKQGTGQKSLSSTYPSLPFSSLLWETHILYTNCWYCVADESGLNENVTRDFPGAEVRYGEMANHGGSGSRKIPPEQGGDYDARGRWDYLSLN